MREIPENGRRMQLIINRSTSVPISRRLGWGVVTLFFWTMWVYLWMPLVTLIAWGFGFYGVYSKFKWEAEVMEFTRLVIIYFVIASALGGTLLLWAFSEYMRFRDKNRRTMPRLAAPEELAGYAKLQTEQLVAWRDSRCMIAHHDSHGALLSVDAVEQR
jgi:biofilm PGA synthesis protein PgaD